MASQMEVTQVDQYESDEDVIENNDSIKEVKKVHRKRPELGNSVKNVN